MRKPHPQTPHPDCSLGFPGQDVGGRQQGLPEEESLTCSVQVLSPPGLACSPAGSHTLSLRGWRDGHQ